MTEQIKFEVYIPESYLEELREALHHAGACRVGNYDHVLSWSHVQGCWRPLPGSSPFCGETNMLSMGSEIKVEFQCAAPLAANVLAAIRRVHPYEEPVIYIIPLRTFLPL